MTLIKAEFNPSELNEKAWEIYVNTDPINLYRERGGETYYEWDRQSDPREIGNIEDVNEFLVETYGSCSLDQKYDSYSEGIIAWALDAAETFDEAERLMDELEKEINRSLPEDAYMDMEKCQPVGKVIDEYEWGEMLQKACKKIESL